MMYIKSFWNELDWGSWIYGMWAAIVGGGSTAASGAIAVISVDPKDFNLETAKFWKVTCVMFTIGAATNFLSFLKQNPAPAIISRTTTKVTQTEDEHGATATITTKQETSTPVKLKE